MSPSALLEQTIHPRILLLLQYSSLQEIMIRL
jgi:hypothetical protein